MLCKDVSIVIVFAQSPFLTLDALYHQEGIGYATKDGSEISCMNEWDCCNLQNDSQPVWMAQVTVDTGVNHRYTGNGDDGKSPALP